MAGPLQTREVDGDSNTLRQLQLFAGAARGEEETRKKAAERAMEVEPWGAPVQEHMWQWQTSFQARDNGVRQQKNDIAIDEPCEAHDDLDKLLVSKHYG
ncbi:hypothetical protein EJB05_36337 [Eragrostis curvula]|uniref:Uncharacterized protein n=1 Tax=Eragrostis curvula TaxID=38414 RepID=A0A5J9U973_9POAL|nr:hypothetical protein EJB05_36337 [Eragrostis curvula]